MTGPIPASLPRTALVRRPAYHDRIRAYIKDGTLSFWEEDWCTWSANERQTKVMSTLNQIKKYTRDDRARFTLCTSQNAVLDFDRIVREGWWGFVNIPAQHP